MDPLRFDSLTRALCAPGSRRTVSRALAALGIGAVLAPLLGAGANPVRGKGRHHNKKKKKKHTCDPGETPCGNGCCRAGWFCLGTTCARCPLYSTYCGGLCCETIYQVCCGDTICCDRDFTCAYVPGTTPVCCPPDQPACGFLCCDPGSTCCQNQVCCPQGTECRTGATGQAICCAPGRLVCGDGCCSADAGECCQMNDGTYYCCTQGLHCKQSNGPTCV